ncbi:MAG: hypothetical protein Q6L50_10270, partial [Gloeomargarita sp. GMQP_bins_120]
MTLLKPLNLVIVFWLAATISTLFYDGLLDKFIAIIGFVFSYFSITIIRRILEKDRVNRHDILTFALSSSIAISSFWTLVFYPALMSPDSLDQWRQATQNRYNTWHPPIMAILMRLTQIFSKDPALFAFIQGFLFWLALFVVLGRLARSNKSYLVSCAWLVSLPSLWPYTSTLWKDVWTCTMALLGINFLLDAIETRKQRNNSSYYLTVSLLLFSLAV